jgi:hypothetical protein
MRYSYYIILTIVMLAVKVYGQQNNTPVISVNFESARLDDVVKELQSKSGYLFYYKFTKADSLKINVKVDSQPLDDILKQVFANTSFQYTILQRQVFISKDRALIGTLASGIFYDEGLKSDPAKVNNELVDYTDGKMRKPVVATVENKLYEIGVKTNEIKRGSAILSGYVHDKKTGESAVAVSVYDDELKRGVATDQFGYYAITLPKGRHTLVLRGIGMRDTRLQIILYSDGKLNVDIQEKVLALREVNISAQNAANVKSVRMGVDKIDIKSIKQVPTAFGEADILRVVLTLPGVQSVGEASTGFNVRGGSADQNLILLNDLTIYNPSHFFGFFSAFNPDIVKDVQLYKSSIPEKFGGRLSSVLEVTNREGNKKKFTGSAGIGLITSRFNIEGPIDSNKTSFIFGGRTTYSNWLLNLLPKEYKNSSANFYDMNLDISHQINEKNNIYLTTYISSDKFSLNSDTNYNYSNKNIALKWKHIFNNKLFGLVSGGFDRYQFGIASSGNAVNAYKLDFDINQANFKADFSYYASAKHTFNFGLSSIYYKLNPGSYLPNSDKSLVAPDVVPGEKALESALYLGDKFDISQKFSINAGIRFSIYNYLGPQTVNNYAPGLPRTNLNRLDSTVYQGSSIIKTYMGPEYRLAARYSISDDVSIKAAYNTLRQYIHLLSNTTAIAPTDIWKLSDPNIKPQYGDQVSLGIYKNFSSNTVETSIEVYYKRLHDYLDYRSGANLVLNHHIETDVLSTHGKAYGVEFLIKKTTGKANGWISYTYSRTFLQANDFAAGEVINNGDYYPANYDKPHAFNFIGNYRVSHRFSASLNATYSTGRPITLPVAKYVYAGSERVYYSDRNAYRIPDYFRMDFSINVEGNHKVHQLTHNSWTLGVYNLTGRANPYSNYFISSGGVIKGYQLSIFATAIPFVNYNIRF